MCVCVCVCACVSVCVTYLLNHVLGKVVVPVHCEDNASHLPVGQLQPRQEDGAVLRVVGDKCT